MLTKSLIVIVASTAALAAPVIAHAQGARTMNTTVNATSTPTKTGHLEVSGVNYYYEIRGKGEPLLLLHGGLGTIDMFGSNLVTLSAQREVIAVDLQGHGRTTLGKRPISLAD